MMSDPNQNLIEQLSEMGARRLVRWLTTPALSGFYLSPDDIQRIGSTLGIRITPFGRANGLEQFLRSAALDGKLAEALGALRLEMAEHLATYRFLELQALEGWVERGAATLDAWTAIEKAFEEEDQA